MKIFPLKPMSNYDVLVNLCNIIHLNKTARIGRVQGDGSIEEVWSSPDPIRPDPYLSTYAWARGL